MSLMWLYLGSQHTGTPAPEHIGEQSHLRPWGVEELAVALSDLLATPVPRIPGHLHLNI